MTEFDYAAARQHLVDIGACDRCIGRQFYRLFEGMDQGAIGAMVRQSETLEQARHAQPDGVILKEDCPICNGLFLKTTNMAEGAMELLANMDYEHFLVGCRVDNKLLGREEQLWLEVGALYCEPLKKDLVRQIGLAICNSTGKDVDFKRPDITIIADFVSGKVSLQIHSLFIYGEYSKLIRGIPQTKWFCRKCRGRGCKVCSFTGKQYSESVEELVAHVPVEETGAKSEKFHGSGREDIDATMLGRRPFVLELQEPVLRFLDWEELTKKINSHAEGKVKVYSLRPSSKEEVRRLKAVRHDKSYEAIINCETDPSEEKLLELTALFKTKEIEQRTPERVAHRRADLVRKRTIYSVEVTKINPNTVKAVIRAEAGAYIKELISGDSGRTKPSFTEFLGPCKCEELNVLEVHTDD